MQASAAAAYESHTMLRRRHGHRQHEDAHLHLRIRLESAAARVLSAERGPAGSTCRSAAKKIVDRDAQLDHGSNACTHGGRWERKRQTGCLATRIPIC